MRSSVCIYFNRPYSRTEKEILFVFIFRYSKAAHVSTRGFVVYSWGNKSRVMLVQKMPIFSGHLSYNFTMIKMELLSLLSSSFWLTLINYNALAYILSMLQICHILFAFWNVGCLCTEYNYKGPSIKDVRKNLLFFDPPSPPRPGVSEITDHPPPPPPPPDVRISKFFAISTQILST